MKNITFLLIGLFITSAHAESLDYGRFSAELISASIRCEPLRVKNILDSGAYIEQRDLSTAVNWAVKNGCDEVIEIYIAEDIDLKKIDQKHGLIAHSLGIDSLKNKKGTELVILKSLLKTGLIPVANKDTNPYVNVLNAVRAYPFDGVINGMTLLHKEKQLEAVKILHEYGLDLASIASNGDTLRDIAVISENELLYQYLRRNISQLSIKKKNLKKEKRFLKNVAKNGITNRSN